MQRQGTAASGRKANPAIRPGCRRARVIVPLCSPKNSWKTTPRILCEPSSVRPRRAIRQRLCIERLAPVRKGRPITFDLPPVKTAAGGAVADGDGSRAMAAAERTTDEASAAASVIEMHRRAIETSDIELRLQKLEEGALRR